MGAREYNVPLQNQILGEDFDLGGGDPLLLRVTSYQDWETPGDDRYSEPRGSELARVNAAPDEPEPYERPLSAVANDFPDPRTLDRARSFRIALSREIDTDHEDNLLRDPRVRTPLRRVRRLLQEIDHVARSAHDQIRGLRLQAAHLMHECARTPTGQAAMSRHFPHLHGLLQEIERASPGFHDGLEMAMRELDEGGFGDEPDPRPPLTGGVGFY